MYDALRELSIIFKSYNYHCDCEFIPKEEAKKQCNIHGVVCRFYIMSIIPLIQFFILSADKIKAIITNDIPISQGSEYILLNRDFVTGLLIGSAIVCFVLAIFKERSKD